MDSMQTMNFKAIAFLNIHILYIYNNKIIIAAGLANL